MTEWITTFDAVFWLSVGTLLTGSISIALKYALKSKCEDCSFCFGLIRIKRKVELEAEIEERELEITHKVLEDVPIVTKNK